MDITQSTHENSDSAGVTATAFGLSYAVACLFNAVVVILKETIPAVHDGMAALAGHHWVAHGLLDLIVFVVLGFVFARTSLAHMSAKALITNVVGATVLGGLIIVGFFTLA